MKAQVDTVEFCSIWREVLNMNAVNRLKKYNSRFGVVSVGKIEAFDAGKSLTVAGEAIEPTASFWTRFSPQRVIKTPAPEPKEGEERGEDTVTAELDYTLGFYLVTDSGHDRYLSPEEFEKLEPGL